MAITQPVLEAIDLRKNYGVGEVVKGISFAVGEGEIFGLLGPNGAGKTTTLEISEGLRPATSGTVRLLGVDAGKEPRRVKEMIGIQLQSTSFLDFLTAKEMLELFASFYPKSLGAVELLERVGLSERTGTLVKHLSGGQQQRLALAMALVNDPRVLFLDEPTTGLDPQARRVLWDAVRGLREEGRTVVLTTHYMEEAQELCDRVAIMDCGWLIALDSPGRLIEGANLSYRIQFEAEDAGEKVAAEMAGLGKLERENGLFSLACRELPPVFHLLTTLSQNGNSARGLTVRSPNLEDVFLKLTGRNLRD